MVTPISPLVTPPDPVLQSSSQGLDLDGPSTHPQHGANVNAQMCSGNSALHSASGRGLLPLVRTLVRSGADSGLKNCHNDTPLMVARNRRVSACRVRGRRREVEARGEQGMRLLSPASKVSGLALGETPRAWSLLIAPLCPQVIDILRGKATRPPAPAPQPEPSPERGLTPSPESSGLLSSNGETAHPPWAWGGEPQDSPIWGNHLRPSRPLLLSPHRSAVRLARLFAFPVSTQGFPWIPHGSPQFFPFSLLSTCLPALCRCPPRPWPASDPLPSSRRQLRKMGRADVGLIRRDPPQAQ